MKKFKGKKTLLVSLSAVIFLIVGLIFFAVGSYLTGWNVFEWFVSPTAYFVYALLAVVLIFIISLLVYQENNK